MTCEICGVCETLVVDHDHETGLVRGRVCQRCNLRLGWLEALDGLGPWTSAAREYIRKSQHVQRYSKFKAEQAVDGTGPRVKAALAGANMTLAGALKAIGAKTFYAKEAIYSMVESGEILRSGSGRKGDPYRYSSGPGMAPGGPGGTKRDQETDEEADLLEAYAREQGLL
jgi:hypothetical protein